MFLRPQEIAKKLGCSVTFTRTLIGKSNCPIKKGAHGEKSLFNYEYLVNYIKGQV